MVSERMRRQLGRLFDEAEAAVSAVGVAKAIYARAVAAGTASGDGCSNYGADTTANH